MAGAVRSCSCKDHLNKGAGCKHAGAALLQLKKEFEATPKAPPPWPVRGASSNRQAALGSCQCRSQDGASQGSGAGCGERSSRAGAAPYRR